MSGGHLERARKVFELKIIFAPVTNNIFMPSLSYIFPANGLMTAITAEPGRTIRPETVAEHPIIDCA